MSSGESFSARLDSGSRELREQDRSRADADPVLADEVLPTRGADLPGLASGHASLQIADATIDLGIRPLALDQRHGLPPLQHHKVHLPAVGVPEVSQLEV